MKKFVAVIMSTVLLLSVSLPVFAISGEDLLKGALITVINEAVKQDQNKNSKSETKSKSKKSKTETPQPTVTTPEPEPQTLSQEQEQRLYQIGARIERDLSELGNNMLKYNKPALDVKLSKKERTVPEEYYDDGSDPNTKMILSDVMYSRVCVKGKTIVLGSAKKDKNFEANSIITGEPDFPPAAKENDLNVPRIYVGQDISVLENFVGMSAQNITKIQQSDPGTINLSESFVPEYIAYKDGKITELYYANGYAVNSDRAINFKDKKAQELGLTFARY